MFHDNTRIILSSDGEWLDGFSNKHNKLGLSNCDYTSLQDGFLLWPVINRESVYSIMREDYGFSNQITLIRTHPNSCEMFTFATHIDVPSMHNVYINNLDELYKLSLKVKDKIKPVIRASDIDREILARCVQEEKMTNLEMQSSEDKNIWQELLNPKKKKTKVYSDRSLKNSSIASYIKRIYVNWALDCDLTEREFDCFLLLIEGKSAGRIASILSISPRTVETHISRIKMKFQCKNKEELMQKCITKARRLFPSPITESKWNTSDF